MAFNDTYVESIQTKHVSNVGFTSTAKGVTNEAFALKNPHQVLSNQIPLIDVVSTYGPLVASGIAAAVAEEHTVKLTADPTVNSNKAWIAYETDCIASGHSGRGALRIDKWMRYAETQYKLRLYEDNGSGTAPDYTKEILPSDVNFNWEYDASAGIVYFDADPDTTKIIPLWGSFYTYTGDTVGSAIDGISTSVSGIELNISHDCTYVDNYHWIYDSNGEFTEVPSALSVFVNGVKQKTGDSEYYIASMDGDILTLTFGFKVHADDWVNIIYNQSDFVASDHGRLTGLSDDDHSQYLNEDRGDARYYTKTLLSNGQLDTRYYTETEVNSLIATVSGGTYLTSPTADLMVGTIISFTAGEDLNLGNIVYFKSDSMVWKADADTVTTMPAIGIAASSVSANASVDILLNGVAHLDTLAPNWTVGGLIYVSSTAGGFTQATVSGSGVQAQVVGLAIASDILLFNPSYVLVELV